MLTTEELRDTIKKWLVTVLASLLLYCVGLAIKTHVDSYVEAKIRETVRVSRQQP